MESLTSATEATGVARSNLVRSHPQVAPNPIDRVVDHAIADTDADHVVVHGYAVEMSQSLRQLGTKLVCIDFDATFVRVHTGGAWVRSAHDLRAFVRPLFLALVPLLVRAGIHVAVVTFSPQVALIREVLALCFHDHLVRKLILRGDDASWQLVHAETVEFLPLWQTNGRHLDRTFKLPFVISAALQASRERRDVIRNKDTVLFDDDAMNIRVAKDSGIAGIYFDPQERTDFLALMKQIRRLESASVPSASSISTTDISHDQHPALPHPTAASDHAAVPNPASSSTAIPMTPLRTPSKKHPTARMVRLMTTPENAFFSAAKASSARRGLHGSGAASVTRTSRFHLCTPSPVMRLKSTVDMGKPRSKRSIRLMRNIEDDLQELHLLQQKGSGASAGAEGLLFSNATSTSRSRTTPQDSATRTRTTLRMSLELTTSPPRSPPGR